MNDENGIAPTILRLRALREKLCSSQDDWHQAFEVRDFVMNELQTLHEMLVDEEIERCACVAKVEDILKAFNDGSESCGV